MSEHARFDDMLVAYVDGELDGEQASEVERLMAGDASVRADVELFRETAMLLRSACGEQHYARAMRVMPQAARPRRLAWWSAAAAAAILLASGGFGAGRWWTQTGGDPFLDEVAEYHGVISRETTHLAELPAERSDELVGWLGERLGRRLNVPDLAEAGLRFAGGRMLVMNGAPVADFLYTRQDGPPVALCMVRGALAPSALRVTARDGLQLASWSRDGYTFVIVGALAPDASRELAGLVASRIEG